MRAGHVSGKLFELYLLKLLFLGVEKGTCPIVADDARLVASSRDMTTRARQLCRATASLAAARGGARRARCVQSPPPIVPRDARAWSATAASSHGPSSSGDAHHRRDPPATAVIAIGSNQGDRVDLFRRALRALDEAGIAGTRAPESRPRVA